MNYLVKIVDFQNNVFYATPGEQPGIKYLGGKEKAEVFPIKKVAVNIAVKMKQLPEMRNFIYHIEQID